MKYVLDSSVALKWVLAEVDSHKAIRLRDAYVAGVHELIAPDIFASPTFTASQSICQRSMPSSGMASNCSVVKVGDSRTEGMRGYSQQGSGESQNQMPVIFIRR